MDIAHQLSVTLSVDLSLFPVVPFLTSDMTPVEAAVHLLRGSLLKKWEPSGVSKAAEDAAFEKFSEVNRRMLSWRPEPESDLDHILLSMFEDQLHRLLGARMDDECDFLRVADGLGFGPGSVVDADSSNFYTKVFGSTLTATSEWLVTLYRTAVSRNPSWALAERRRFEQFGFTTVSGCRLFFAPKYAHIARTCSTQPAVNMALQKGADSFILSRLREWLIDLSNQADKNSELARLGSIDGEICTVDLSSASDCTSLALVKRYVPDPLKSWILRTRTPVTEYKNRQIELGMVSMMGNGFTFSLETAIFASVVRATYLLAGLPLTDGKSNTWGVFGDDLCVNRKVYTMVTRLLGLLGYEVNDDKSFCVGSFRESCGSDWWKGHPVRGIYLRSLRTDAEIYSAINRLNWWSGRTRVPLTCTIQLLLSMLRGTRPFYVPISEQDDAGLKVPFDRTRPRVADDYCFLYRKLSVVPQRWHPKHNEDGSLDPSFGVAILGGYLRGPDSGLYPDDGRFPPEGVFWGPSKAFTDEDFTGFCRTIPGAFVWINVLSAKIPYWDWAPRDSLRGVSYDDWKVAVTGNLLL
jgi:hypothetical protein